MFLKRIWRAIEDDRRLMFWSVLFGFAFTGLGIVPPLLVRRMIHWLQQPETAGSFVWLAVILAVIYLLRGVTRYLYGLMSHIAAYNALHRLMNRVYQHLQRLSPSYLDKRHSGNLAARTIGDVEAVEDFIAHGIPETILAIVIPVTMSCVLLAINWQLALVALAPLPVVAFVTYIVRTRTTNYWKAVRIRFADLAGRVQDHLTGLRVVQSFRREQQLAQDVEDESRDYRDRIIHANKWSLVPAGIIEVATGAGLVLIVSMGALLHTTFRLDVADLVVFLMYLNQIFVPFLRLANLNENLQKASASAERVFELIDTQPEIVDAPDAAVPNQPSFDVSFDRVRFRYSDDIPVLNDVSFAVSEGETVAIVGTTGAGKSTLCHLLVRFYDIQSGTIRLGDHDLRSLPLEYLREHVAFVSQDAFLFAGTIRQNLLIGNPDASDEQLRDAVQTANAAEFIESFPNGYETLVGERGVRLSGGQKQRIAIARALLKNAPVLVLDEATSAVDSDTESQIREALMRLTSGRTVIIVAHRLSTIMSADRIVVIDEGRVVEDGTYDELESVDGHFTKLCRLHQDAIW